MSHLTTLLLGNLVFALVAGGTIGLILWRRRPETARGHPVASMLRWMGVVVGLFVLHFVLVLFWNWYRGALLFD